MKKLQQPKVVICDFGGQYAHLIGRRVHEQGCLPIIVNPEELSLYLRKNQDSKGLILSGGARSVYEKNAPRIEKSIFNIGLPILGICYGHQLIAYLLGGKVIKGKRAEYGPAEIRLQEKNRLFEGTRKSFGVWMNHRDIVAKAPQGFSTTASSANTPVAAFADDARKIYGVQFHPEVSQTQFGERIFGNFLRLASSYKRSSRINVRNLIAKAKMAIGKERALIALSGGVDSSVAAVLVARAVGRRLLAVYVDTGLMRSGETKQIQKTFRRFPFRLRTIFAQSRFYRALRGVTDPEDKRRRIGKLFIKIFEEEARRFRASVLVQGTIYSDRIESGSTKYSSRIKSHHNVGGLPKSLKIRLYEPLAEFYKDEVRRISTRLGLPAEINQRKVFPGPGLAIRIIGEVKPEKVRIVREADMIIQEELQHSKYFKKIWMTFPILLSIKSVGIQGDERSYKYPIVLRILESQDAMTARAAEIPFAILQRISTRITNEIEEVNRVLYDLTSKPPATMEWE